MSNRSIKKPVIVPALVKFIVIDSFCGAGGFTEGIEQAVGINGFRLAVVGVGINHDKDALASHAINHPETTHFVEDVRDKTLPRRIAAVVCELRKLYPNAIVWFHASLECFPAGTMILTSTGLKPIEVVSSGELVLTHTGNWKPVTAIMSKVADTVILKGQGHPGLETTDEHPFYARKQTKVWKNDIRRWEYKEMGEPDWVKAEELTGNQKYRWATPVSAEILPTPEIGGRGMDQENPDFWWMVGRWLGDGLSAPSRGGQISIVCGNHEVDDLENRLSGFSPESLRAKNSELRWQHRKLRTASIFYCSHIHLSKWLIDHFGRLSHGKTIPAWALTMHPKFRQALLDGYISADGHKATKRTQATSVSKRLALGIRLLAESLGHRCSLHEYESHNSVIEGRTVKVRNQWVVAWDNNKSDRGAFEDRLHAWSLVKEKTEGRKNQLVYNLSVADDESYVADGIVVHNCTNFSNAKGGKSRDADSRSLADVMPAYLKALKPQLFTVENVREFMAWGPMIAKPNPKHTFEGHRAPVCEMKYDKKDKVWDYHWIPESRTKGQDYQRWLRQICELGYGFDYRLLNAADFGAYTSRLRYFAIFGKPGVPVHWPQATHSKKAAAGGTLFEGLKQWMPVREVLDFSDEGHSIFGRKTNPALRKQDRKDLCEKTLERIYAGLIKHVASGDATFLSKYYSGDPTNKNISIDGPAGSLTTVDSHAVIKAAYLVQRQNDVAGRDAAGRTVSINGPARTITTTGGNQELVQTAFLTKYLGNNPKTGINNGCSIDEPCISVTTQDRIGLVQPAFLSKYNGGSPECRNTSLSEPCGTLTTENRCALVSASFLSTYYGNGNTTSMEEPAGTVTTKDRLSLIQTEHFVDQQYGNSVPASIDDPAGTLTENPKLAIVRTERFMTNYYSSGGQTEDLDDPTTALTTIPKQRLITVEPADGFLHNPGWFGASSDLNDPAPTIVARQDKAPVSVVQTMLLNNQHQNVPTSADEPAPTLLTGNHHYLLNAQFDHILRPVDEVAPTITADRHYPYLVVTQAGELAIAILSTDSPATVKIKQFMAAFGIIDIKMRMLNVPELKRIQGFPDTYVLKGPATAQKKFIGNAVVPRIPQRMAEALATLL